MGASGTHLHPPEREWGHQLAWTSVSHRRRVKPLYSFSYRMFSLLLDLDALSDLDRQSKLFNLNRFGLFSFYESDHGPRDGSPPRPWLERHLARAGIELEGGRIRLLCLPRILGYGFNPISVWYCHHRDGSLRAVLCEVHNTFGEQHSYLLHENGQPMHWPLKQRRGKHFHVSPFFSVEGEYRFTLTEPTDRLAVVVALEQGGEGVLVASQAGHLTVLNDRQLLKALFLIPLATLKVTAAIHWQALKIWLRGAVFHRKPEPPTQEVS
ncbi:MAG: DUF1365 domain-containing protein [Gammaproteobacteria bacterium]